MNKTDLDPLMAQLRQMLPGIPEQDVARFAASLATPGAYALGADSQPQDGVPRGELRSGRCPAGTIYPGVPHDYQVYVPAACDATQPAALMVFQDGARYLGPELNAAAVLDKLIHAGSIPPTIGVFVEPGIEGPGLPIYGGAGNRSVEYDSTGDAYARFLLEELLPEATRGLSITRRPELCTIVGLSSGGHCAFNVAWERPDAFGKVVSHCGSFTNIRGGHETASRVRRSEHRPLKVSLQTGDHDLDNIFGHWPTANRDLAAALAYRGYDHQLTVGAGGHSLAHGGAVFPDTLRWLFEGYTDAS
jgi:enterochelin esterase-like enzyme